MVAVVGCVGRSKLVERDLLGPVRRREKADGGVFVLEVTAGAVIGPAAA